MLKMIILAVACLLLTASCIGKNNQILTPEQLCIEKCLSLHGTNLSKGPCLLNPMLQFPEWVCDVAHNPRVAVDNQQKNQCSSFREGKAKHFIEVDETCVLIKKA